MSHLNSNELLGGNKLLTIKDLCLYFNRHRSTLWSWVDSGNFPQPVKINGRTLGWKPETIKEWLSEQGE